MLRSTVASFAIGRAAARKPHHGAVRSVTSTSPISSFPWVVTSKKRQEWRSDVCPRQPKPWMLARGGAVESLSTSRSSTALNSAVTAESETAAPVQVFRTDYQPLPYLVSKINMDFVIQQGKTTVTSELFIERNEEVTTEGGDLVLDGDEACVKLLSVSMNGKELEKGKDYTLQPQKMIIKSPAPGSVLKTVVEIVPEENTQLSGLYKSGPMYCTQVSQRFR
jgi:hypothetical protein